MERHVQAPTQDQSQAYPLSFHGVSAGAVLNIAIIIYFWQLFPSCRQSDLIRIFVLLFYPFRLPVLLRVAFIFPSHQLVQLFQGRALLNAIGNLELRDSYAQALRTFGYELEDVAHQVWTSLVKSALSLLSAIVTSQICFCPRYAFEDVVPKSWMT